MMKRTVYRDRAPNSIFISVITLQSPVKPEIAGEEESRSRRLRTFLLSSHFIHFLHCKLHRFLTSIFTLSLRCYLISLILRWILRLPLVLFTSQWLLSSAPLWWPFPPSTFTSALSIRCSSASSRYAAPPLALPMSPNKTTKNATTTTAAPAAAEIAGRGIVPTPEELISSVIRIRRGFCRGRLWTRTRFGVVEFLVRCQMWLLVLGVIGLMSSLRPALRPLIISNSLSLGFLPSEWIEGRVCTVLLKLVYFSEWYWIFHVRKKKLLWL